MSSQTTFLSGEPLPTRPAASASTADTRASAQLMEGEALASPFDEPPRDQMQIETLLPFFGGEHSAGLWSDTGFWSKLKGMGVLLLVGMVPLLTYLLLQSWGVLPSWACAPSRFSFCCSLSSCNSPGCRGSARPLATLWQRKRNCTPYQNICTRSNARCSR